MIITDLLMEMSRLENVESIGIGGSRANGYADKGSDYDVYIYFVKPISREDRYLILQKYCKQIECNNTFWETEDNCILNDDIPVDLIYRNIKDFETGLEEVVFNHKAANGYTTCLWHNLLHSEIFFDRSGALKQLQEKFNVSYPEGLKNSIIQKNRALLYEQLPNYKDQILKAVQRNDKISINHRTAEFFASYFDVIFALNRKTHPGEKRLVSICIKECEILPKHFEENINNLFANMFKDVSEFLKALEQIIFELKIVIDEK